MRILSFIVVVLLLTGCFSTTTGVMQIGENTYTVTASGYNYNISGPQQKAIHKKASAFCSSIGKKVTVQSLQSRGGEASMVFHCFAEDDPNYKPVIMENTPDTVIEDRR